MLLSPNSSQALRDKIVALFGEAPAHYDRSLLRAAWIDSPIGQLVAVADPHVLHLLEFVERKGLPGEVRRMYRRGKAAITLGHSPVVDQLEKELEDYFAGRSAEFATPLARFGTPFQHTVWDALQEIPVGQTRSYAQMAQVAGKPSAVRAMARANGANQIAIVIPCHRVIGSDGHLTGYGGGLWRKRWLLEHEQKLAANKADG